MNNDIDFLIIDHDNLIDRIEKTWKAVITGNCKARTSHTESFVAKDMSSTIIVKIKSLSYWIFFLLWSKWVS